MLSHWRLWPFLLALFMGVLESKRHPQRCSFPVLIDATSIELQDGLRRGCFKSVDLVKAYIARITEVNSALNAVLEINKDALEIAEQLDQERKQGRIRGPLHGLPILIKDLIGTSDGMETAAGSYALVGAKVREDATVVTKLRENGAIILGKTSLSEWANFRSLNSSNGWNARGGQTYGAYYLNQDPSGSSSGSGVATDLGLAAAALGTETSGSIILPGEKSNIVGIKPTVGLTSRYMVIPISERQDTIGPMARTVKDAAMLLQVIAGVDVKDNYTLASPFGKSPPDYAAACTLSGLKGKRIGVPRNVINTLGNPRTPTISTFERAISLIAGAGATIVEDANFTAYNAFLQSQAPSIVVAADFLSSLPRLEDIRHFTMHSSLEDYPSRDTGLWDLVLLARVNNTSPEFWSLYQQALRFGEEGGLLGALSRNKLDAVILPSYLASSIPGIIGSPIITVPFGAFPKATAVRYNSRANLVQEAPGIPLGISFLGAKWSEETLIAMAYAFEQQHRRGTKDLSSPSHATVFWFFLVHMEDLDNKCTSLRSQIAATEAQLAGLKRELQDAEEAALKSRTQGPASAVPDHRDLPRKWPLLGEEYRRYGRQMIVPQLGLQGQLKLRSAKVLIVGAGGLGCPAALYLAGAGVGTIGLIDGDTVESSNLHRQVLHKSQNVGKFKVDSAIEYLRELNPHPTYIAHRTHLLPPEAPEIFQKYDLILDCTDNPATRYLISDTAVLLGKTLVSASALRTEGQLMVLNNPPRPAGDKTGGPCYRCVFPRPPPANSVTSCADGGILGPVVGTMGVLQALEAIKVLTATEGPNATTPPSLLIFSAYSSPQFRTIKLRSRRPDCAVCSAEASVTLDSVQSGSMDYVFFCGTVAPEALLSAEERISPLDYRAKHPSSEKGPTILDVREKVQFDICSLENSINIPISTILASSASGSPTAPKDILPAWLPPHIGSPDSNEPIYVVCRLGNDSQTAVRKLKELGIDRGGQRVVVDIKGGLRSWREQIEPDWPEY
ncbi:hypothetical protein ARAM_001004 [Aspergillus rambellii]|uniref:Adenylyltransferase and sulfurtransferase uba4 n=1 Tax=Aspergillus rambellii TaxID=308745 RepID=A0A0F8XAD9_9EURO|nr:hypothetical protein ARAM_001004 [Aspergillus rambellii]